MRPYPKAEARKTTRKSRKKRKSAILTDTPIKEALRIEQEAAKAKKLKKTPTPKKTCKQTQKKKRKADSEDDDEDETLCLYCLSSYSNSRPGEKWIQCTECYMWAHEECAGGSDIFLTNTFY